LRRVLRRSRHGIRRRQLGAVTPLYPFFIALIRKVGPMDGTAGGDKPCSRHIARQTLPQMNAEAAEPLPAFDDPAFARCSTVSRTADVVLLGEASHGTSEFYRARAAITTAPGGGDTDYSIVAVEADWPTRHPSTDMSDICLRA